MEQKGRAELLLEGLKTRVEDAPSATFNSDKAVLDRAELLKVINNVTEVVKSELKTYRETNDKKNRRSSNDQDLFPRRHTLPAPLP